MSELLSGGQEIASDPPPAPIESRAEGGLWSRYVAFWNEREAPEALALVRITFGLGLMANVLEQLFNGNVLETYATIADGGVYPNRVHTWLTLFRWIHPTATVVHGVLWLQLAGALLLTAGFLTRPAALLCMVIQITLYDRLMLFRFDADNVFRVFLYLFVLAPTDAAWSVRSWRAGGARATIPAWPRRLLIAQLTILYCRTGIVKVGSTWSILDGWSALYYALNLPGLARWPGEWAAHFYPLTQLGTFVAKWWEITFFVAALSLYLSRDPEGGGRLRRLLSSRYVRLGYLLVGTVLHLSLVVIMNLGLFPFVMMSLYPSLLTPAEARRGVGRLFRRRN